MMEKKISIDPPPGPKKRQTYTFPAPPQVERPLTFLEKIFHQALSRSRSGCLRVVFPGGLIREYGEEISSNERAKRPLPVLTIQSPDFFRLTILRGDIGFGEAWTEGLWDTDDLHGVLTFLAKNAPYLPTFSGGQLTKLGIGILNIGDRIRHFFRPNSKRGSRRNISEHYDLSNKFFQLMLDESMAYSSGIYYSASESLEEAQTNKFARICHKLQLEPEDQVVEIGCGWGGFAIYAAREFGCHVTGITISREQHDFAIRKVREAGLEDKIEIRLQDYRDVSGKFDKIVSIEMVEALGYKYFDTFFRQVNRLLKPRGLAVIQAITFPDSWFESYRRNTDWIQRHIFPGSLLLSTYEIAASLKRTGDLMITNLQSINESYAQTLRDWRDRFLAAREQILGMGFTNNFIRKWMYYLVYCEVGFEQGYIDDIQIQLSHPLNATLRDF